MLIFVAVAKLVVQKMADYEGRPRGRRLCRSLLDRRKAALVQWHCNGIGIAYGHLNTI